MKKFLIIVVVAVVLIGGGMLLKKDKPTVSGKATSNTVGKSTSGVKLVQYGDFQCPGCGAFYPIVKEVTDHYKDEISFQFINFPLTQIHQNALAAARSAEAAALQGKFWEMHDLLYQNQTAWAQASDPASYFETYAGQLKLDMTKYAKDFASAETNAIINADIATGQTLKVTGTPTFFLDGKQIEDNNTISTVAKFEEAIDAAIKAKTGKDSNSGKATGASTDATTPTTAQPADSMTPAETNSSN